MSDQRILRYQVVLMENSGLTISLCEVLTQPPSCLPPRAFSPFTLALDHWAKPQEGLLEDPLTNPGEIWYTDGSSFIFHGNRRAGYALVPNFETIEATQKYPWALPKHSHRLQSICCLCGAVLARPPALSKGNSFIMNLRSCRR